MPHQENRKMKITMSSLNRVAKDPIAVKVKLNDLLDNMDINRLNELTDQDLHRLNKYLRAYKKLNEHK